jgi:hypothetical protein
MEKIFNIFPICDNDIIRYIGFKVHEMEGTDKEKIDYLLSKVSQDKEEFSIIAISEDFKVTLPSGEEIIGITHERYNIFIQNGTQSVLFEQIYQQFDAPMTPLNLATMIVDGELKINAKINSEPKFKAPPVFSIAEHLPEDYLNKYLTDEGFDFGSLINDDFLMSIKLLFQNQKYVSMVKLLMSAIDSFAFLEYGDTKDTFKKWLDEFCNLKKIKLNSDELWEYRNSILHMTNTQSRKVIKKEVFALYFYVNHTDLEYMTTNGESKYFNLYSLQNIVNEGICMWIKSYKTKTEKFEQFFKRYDLILSENRYGKIEQ